MDFIQLDTNYKIRAARSAVHSTRSSFAIFFFIFHFSCLSIKRYCWNELHSSTEMCSVAVTMLMFINWIVARTQHTAQKIKTEFTIIANHKNLIFVFANDNRRRRRCYRCKYFMKWQVQTHSWLVCIFVGQKIESLKISELNYPISIRFPLDGALVFFFLLFVLWWSLHRYKCGIKNVEKKFFFFA